MSSEAYIIRFEYMQKHAPANAKHSTIEFNAENLEQARKFILRMITHLRNHSKWYKIYQNDKLIFDSRHCH